MGERLLLWMDKERPHAVDVYECHQLSVLTVFAKNINIIGRAEITSRV